MSVPLRADAPARAVQDPHAVHRLNAMWMVRLRWAAIIGQAITIFVVHGPMGIALPLGPLAVLIVVSAMSNVGAMLWLRRTPPVTEAALGAIMALDLCLFTGLLYYTGGPFNPFSSLYLVHLALGALVLSSRYTWPLVLLAVAANAALFVRHVPLPIDHGTTHPAPTAMTKHEAPPKGERMAMGHGGAATTLPGGGSGQRSHTAPRAEPSSPTLTATHEPLGMHLQGMWVAFGVTAGFIVYFLNRVTRTLAERDAELARVSEQSARAARLASVATLAAGAAHELATPLATIAVVARELERSSAEGTRDDARLIREQVDRCRDIVTQMAGDAGASPGEAPSPVPLSEVVEAALEPVEERARVRVVWGVTEPTQKVVLPLRAVSQALRNVVQNALDASASDHTVELDVRWRDGSVSISVCDEGSGISPEFLDAVTDPFFTTKDPGKGMGLGLFLTHSVVDFLGGSLDIDSLPGRGTRVTLNLPDARLTRGVAEDPA